MAEVRFHYIGPAKSYTKYYVPIIMFEGNWCSWKKNLLKGIHANFVVGLYFAD